MKLHEGLATVQPLRPVVAPQIQNAIVAYLDKNDPAYLRRMIAMHGPTNTAWLLTGYVGLARVIMQHGVPDDLAEIFEAAL